MPVGSEPLNNDAQPPYRALLAMREFVESYSQLPWLLSDAGLQVDVVVTRATHHIKLCRGLHQCFEAPADAPAFAAEVCRQMANGYDLLLLVDEPALDAVFAHPDRFQIARHLPFDPRCDFARCLGRKDLIHDYCGMHGIPMPRTRKAASASEAWQAMEELGLPCVLKQITGSGGQTVQIVAGRTAFEAAIAAHSFDTALLVQKFIAGTTAAATFFAHRGVLRAWMATTKTLSLQGGKGPTVAADMLTDLPIRDLCERFARCIAYHGITGFDMIIDERGRPWVIDLHFGRLTTLSHLGLHCGVHFGRAIENALSGGDRVFEPHSSPLRLVKFPECIQFAIREGMVKLLRTANPLTRSVRYLINPAIGLQLNAVLAWMSFIGSAGVVAGRWKRNIARIMSRRRLAGWVAMPRASRVIE